MITTQYRVDVYFDDGEVNYFSHKYGEVVQQATAGAISSGSQLIDGEVTEWSIWDNLKKAEECEALLKEQLPKA